MHPVLSQLRTWTDTVNIISSEDLQNIPASNMERIRSVKAIGGAVDQLTRGIKAFWIPSLIKKE